MNPTNPTWQTKYGPRRVRHDPPTLKEAIIAAQGLSDEVHAQIEIAASLMDLPPEAVRSEVLKAAPDRNSVKILATTGRERMARTVVVERKASRRMLPPGATVSLARRKPA